ncbi:hypothetical protein NEUTE1DRAFT_68293 [Neurospora tetrasperma FGSC 2508]|uniref:RING-type E3 ubiquitin transferase n=1 Tax=Neurospora tetrasperma (strain FGSC 2508 / ATCC MYA-4615 / P0657) TaxID=510951 RepID=F8MVT2_NEUT8|nr:uncharacterized protein NEUTE1DRAFT_68293 [Neurospora tetrasperma FGSC 2508]EGO53980.1 hypothetical protein NEUTE1DRAFT_68293 [Neurospora tetrasperma FGSC 2508]EGZ68599.1 hypothetical protein NEUTE2DRAFT_160892 [Neurospora tetrasperma FGSC 2509]
MATQYEVEHNIKPSSTAPRRRKVDMSTFTSHLHNIAPESSTPTSTSASTSSQHHNNPHATPNPVDLAALYRLLQDQMGVLALSAPTDENRNFLNSLIDSLEEDIHRPPTQIEGVSQEFLDGLDRVDRKKLKEDEQCPICAERYLDDQYCLVVELPCHHSHRFDLECVGPWLRSKGTCPMCRKEMGKRREVVTKKEEEEEEEEDDMDGLYA